MLAQSKIASLQAVYGKTQKGCQEIARPKFGLDPRQRRVLLLADGIHPLALVTKYFPWQELDDIVHSLLGEEFIYQVPYTAALGASVSNASEYIDDCFADHSNSDSVPEESQQSYALEAGFERMVLAKEFMLETAYIHLGVLGEGLIRKIEKAHHLPELIKLAGQWAIALCESKTGSKYAQLYLEQLKLMVFCRRD